VNAEEEKKMKRMSVAVKSAIHQDRSNAPQFRSLRLPETFNVDTVASKKQALPANPLQEFHSKLQDQIDISRLTSTAQNEICADCAAPGIYAILDPRNCILLLTNNKGPRWASLTFGVFICAECANVMATVLGKQLANLRCIDLTFHYFGPEAIQV